MIQINDPACRYWIIRTNVGGADIPMSAPPTSDRLEFPPRQETNLP